MADDTRDNEWQEWWDARVAAFEKVLGKAERIVGHAAIPFEFGPDIGGAADIIYFKRHIPGVVSVTSELIGRDDQIQNQFGNYELMICHRDDEQWGPNLISRLAHYTLQAELNPGETMDIGSIKPEEATISALLFFDYARFKVKGREAGLLLCVGITADELNACLNGRRAEVEESLKKAGIYPFTDLYRRSVLPPSASNASL